MELTKEEEAAKALNSSMPESQRPSVVNSAKDDNWQEGEKSLEQPVPSPKKKTDGTDPGFKNPGSGN